MKENAEDGVDYKGKCFISHSACLEDARTVADIVEATFPFLSSDVVINSGKNDVEFDLFVSKIGQLLEEREKEN